MHDSVYFEDLGKTSEPFDHATYRQWERELERDLTNKPLPPLPKVPVPTAQPKSERPQIQPFARGSDGNLLSSIQEPKLIATPSPQRQQLAPVNSGLFPPIQPHGEWERRAQRMALRERVKVENPEFKSMWSPATVNEKDKSTRCCCVM